MSTCYKSLVRPQLEYASTVWDPSTKSNITKVEAVQRRAARFVIGDYSRTSSVTTMLQHLEWKGLQTRRQHAKVTMMHRIVHRLVEIPIVPYFHPTGAHTRGHASRFLQPFTTVNSYRDSFFPSGIRLWNSLPVSLIDAPSLEVFQTRMVAMTE